MQSTLDQTFNVILLNEENQFYWLFWFKSVSKMKSFFYIKGIQ